jgi:hypothetical protein
MPGPASRVTPHDSPPAGTERECPRCGTVAVNQDFCPCGEYLGWEVSLTPAPAAEPASSRPAEPPEPRPATLLTLRDPARQDDPGAAVSVSVVPGSEVMALASVRNQGEIVDTFDIRVDGLPDAWWTVSSETVFLNPWGSSGEYQREVRLQLHPPRSAESEARAWPFTVVARSRSLGADVAWVPATLTVQPFHNTTMTVGPERRSGRRRASFDVAVLNRGNSPTEIAVGARDTEARCPVTVVGARAVVPVGGSATARVRVGVPKPLIFRRPVEHNLDIAHRASGDAEPVPQRVTFRQKPWLPWWVPAVVALFAAFMAAVLLLRRDAEVPKLKGDTIEEAVVVLDKHHLGLGRTTYATAPDGVPLGTVLDQAPAAGDAVAKGERVNITLAAPPKTALVPPVNGLTLAKAADALTAAHFAYDPQPSSAGNDWVVIRQQPTPGTKLELGAKVTLAVENRTPAATPTATPSPTATPTAAPASAAPAKPRKAKAKAKVKVKAPPAPLPANLVFADATNGRLYRWASADVKPAGLTSPKHRLETPTKTDEGYVAVELARHGRRLVRVSAEGKVVDPIAKGDYHRPVYSPAAGLLAVTAADGDDSPADAGALCVLDPQDTGAPACALADRRVGRPSWTPDGRSVFALAVGPDSNYDELLNFTVGDGRQWGAPTSVYRWADIQAAVPVGNDRIAVLVAESAGAPAHLRVLARRANGRFAPVRDFPELTGFELAVTGHQLALRRGNHEAGDGAIVLLDVDRAQPRVRTLGSGANPAWAESAH